MAVVVIVVVVVVVAKAAAIAAIRQSDESFVPNMMFDFPRMRQAISWDRFFGLRGIDFSPKAFRGIDFGLNCGIDFCPTPGSGIDFDPVLKI